jgi:predicted cobalt transporter CbtA
MAIVGRAVAAGVIGGLLTALFVTLIGEQSIEAAITIEEAVNAPATSGGEATTAEIVPEVSRSVQIAGGALAVVLYGVLTGVVFGTVLAAVRHRLPMVDDFRRSVLLAGAGFAAVAILPAVKYPANPPAVGDPDTINQRTVAYLTLVAAGLVLAVVSAMVHRRLSRRLDQPTTLTLTALVALAGAVALMLLWPDSPDRIPAGFPADLLWRFRLQSLATLAIQWATLGLGTGWLLTRRRISSPTSSTRTA